MNDIKFNVTNLSSSLRADFDAAAGKCPRVCVYTYTYITHARRALPRNIRPLSRAHGGAFYFEPTLRSTFAAGRKEATDAACVYEIRSALTALAWISSVYMRVNVEFAFLYM